MKSASESPSILACVLTIGFGMTVAMWTLGYVSRLPGLMLPSPLLFVIFLGCLLAGGWVMGRVTGLGWTHGAAAGLVSGVLNLLILGSFLSADTPNVMRPTALAWVPGFVLVAALLSAIGAALGKRPVPVGTEPIRWDGEFVRVAVVASFFLMIVGGLVTSTDTGLAVVDWPNSYGYNMFLYPFSKMTGGIYFEHAHRLFAFLVGVTTLVMAILLQLREPRRWVRGTAWFAVALVAAQAVLGGLRVTGQFTMSASPEVMRPQIVLALIHGVVAQLFFGLLVALMVFTSRTWRGPTPAETRGGVATDRWTGGLLVVLMMLQLVLGAAQRHLSEMLLVHIAFGVAIVTPLAVHVGLRSWGKNPGLPVMGRLGLMLAGAVAVQIGLGLAAFASTAAAVAGTTSALEVILTTAHQGFGAALMGLAVGLFCWHFRLLEEAAGHPATAPAGTPVTGR